MRLPTSDKSTDGSLEAFSSIKEFARNNEEVFLIIVEKCLALHLESNDKYDRVKRV